MRCTIKGVRSLTAIVGLCCAVAATPASANIFVTSGEGSNARIIQFSDTGQNLGHLQLTEELTNPQSLIKGPDGNFYVNNQDAVLKYSGTTGGYLGKFVDLKANSQFDSKAIAFGPDGKLYVASGDRGGGDAAIVDRYDGSTGAFVDTFIDPSGGLAEPMSLAFGGGKLYVGDGSDTNYTTDTISVFDAATGASLGLLGSNAALTDPNGLVFGPDGRLYVANEGLPPPYTPIPTSYTVLAYDPATGDSSTFVSSASGGLTEPFGLVFGPNGLLVLSGDNGKVYQYDATSGAFGTVLISGLSDPKGIVLSDAIATAPEPATWAMMLLGMAGLGALVRRRRTAASFPLLG